jgi:pilus assembly protein CpaB
VSRRRRAALLLGLALVLGALAASDVSRREAALERRLGPPVALVVARSDLAPGARLAPADVGVRLVPARYAPRAAFSSAGELLGLRTAVAVPAGSYLTPGQVEAADAGSSSLRSGERIVDVVAVGSPEAVLPGSRVDVLVSREGDRGEPGRTVLALEDVEVLGAAPVTGGGGPAAAAAPAGDFPRVVASLRVTLRQAVYLAAAQAFAREIRLLARAPGDHRRGHAGLTADGNLSS